MHILWRIAQCGKLGTFWVFPVLLSARVKRNRESTILYVTLSSIQRKKTDYVTNAFLRLTKFKAAVEYNLTQTLESLSLFLDMMRLSLLREKERKFWKKKYDGTTKGGQSNVKRDITQLAASMFTA